MTLLMVNILITKHVIALVGGMRTHCRCKDKIGNGKLVRDNTNKIHLTMPGCRPSQ
jgi:hypothetical protein